MGKKKLLLIVPMLHQGGFERVCVRTARILEPYFDITIAIFCGDDIAYDISGLNVEDLNVPAGKSRVKKLWNVGKRVRKLAALKKRLRPDISYSFGPTANLINVLTPVGDRIWTGIRSYMDMDNPGKLKLFIRRSDRVICCSELIALELKEKFGADNLEILYNPFNFAQMEALSRKPDPGMPDFSGKKVMINVSREDDCKEFWHMIKCLFLIRDAVPEAMLCFVGEGSFAEYKRLAEQLGIRDRVCFAGMQKNPFPWMRQSALYLGLSSMEGFPNSLVEAMANGLPAVHSNCKSGPAEILSDRFFEVKERQEYLEEAFGILVPLMDDQKNLDPLAVTEEERKLASFLQELLTDEGRLKRLSAAAQKRAGQFSDEAYGRNFLRIAAECWIAAKKDA